MRPARSCFRLSSLAMRRVVLWNGAGEPHPLAPSPSDGEGELERSGAVAASPPNPLSIGWRGGTEKLSAGSTSSLPLPLEPIQEWKDPLELATISTWQRRDI